jgi:hypothetical protein
MGDITSSWVHGIYNPVTGKFPYQASHVGLIPVNTTSPVTTLQKAYPQVNFGGYEPYAPLNSIRKLKESPLSIRNGLLAF